MVSFGWLVPNKKILTYVQSSCIEDAVHKRRHQNDEGLREQSKERAEGYQ